jgi:hypothetical protein
MPAVLVPPHAASTAAAATAARRADAALMSYPAFTLGRRKAHYVPCRGQAGASHPVLGVLVDPPGQVCPHPVAVGLDDVHVTTAEPT